MVSEEKLITRKNYVELSLDVNPVFIVVSYGLLGLRVACLISVFENLRISAKLT